jgi:hypothetical protein
MIVATSGQTGIKNHNRIDNVEPETSGDTAGRLHVVETLRKQERRIPTSGEGLNLGVADSRIWRTLGLADTSQQLRCAGGDNLGVPNQPCWQGCRDVLDVGV